MKLFFFLAFFLVLLRMECRKSRLVQNNSEVFSVLIFGTILTTIIAEKTMWNQSEPLLHVEMRKFSVQCHHNAMDLLWNWQVAVPSIRTSMRRVVAVSIDIRHLHWIRFNSISYPIQFKWSIKGNWIPSARKINSLAVRKCSPPYQRAYQSNFQHISEAHCNEVDWRNDMGDLISSSVAV